jgi:hypothetical protein
VIPPRPRVVGSEGVEPEGERRTWSEGPRRGDAREE